MPTLLWLQLDIVHLRSGQDEGKKKDIVLIVKTLIGVEDRNNFDEFIYNLRV